MEKIKSFLNKYDMWGYGLLFGSIFYGFGFYFANNYVDEKQKSLEVLMNKRLGLNQLIIKEPNNNILKTKEKSLDSTITNLNENLKTEYLKTFLSWGYFMVDKDLVIPDTSNYPDFKSNKKQKETII